MFVCINTWDVNVRDVGGWEVPLDPILCEREVCHKSNLKILIIKINLEQRKP